MARLEVAKPFLRAPMLLPSLFMLVIGSAPGMKLPMNYVNAARAREAVMAISTVLKQSLWQRILASPFVAVMVDESTDISTSENMILYVTYIYEGRAQCSFVGLVHALEVDAESLHDQLVTFLESHSLSMKKVMVFCSDGVSVMTGDKS